MKKSVFLSNQEILGIKSQDSLKKEEIKKLPQRVQTEIEVANEVFEAMNHDIFDFESEKRVRDAGYTPSEAEEIAFKMRNERIQVGQLFTYQGKQLVLTPFKTVVPAQTYVTSLQDRLFEITTVDQEVMVSQLKTQVRWFTSLSFFGLIGLALKRLFKTGDKKHG